MPKTAAEINAEKIEAIIGRLHPIYFTPYMRRYLAEQIVEACPELRPHQQSIADEESAIAGDVRRGEPPGGFPRLPQLLGERSE